jgi:hypothetical protein
VKITVKDTFSFEDVHNFTLTVHNVNDPPTFTSSPVLEAKVGEGYRYDVNATDIDAKDILLYSLEKGPKGMDINLTSGLIEWMPAQGQEGSCEVIVAVTDSNATIRQPFNIKVHPHIVLTITVPTDGQKVTGQLEVRGTVLGPENVTVEVNLDGKGWQEASGNRTWSYDMDALALKNGNHTIKARATWGEYSSDEVSVTFVVDKPRQSTNVVCGWPILLLLLLIIIVAMFLILSGTKRERSKIGEEEEE